jgi:dolichyl-phosphate-mannose-protein mannosyltransferase
MASGVGVSPDSVIYLSAADRLIVGEGLKPIGFHYSPRVASGKPLVIFPPTYPLLLSLSSIFSADQLRDVKWLHAFLFGANVVLLAVIVYAGTGKSALATLCAVLLFLSSPSVLEIHTMAWSEPPFIFFTLLAVLLLILHINAPHYSLLIGSALSVSLVLTTRYVGITVLPPMILTILILENKPLRRRIQDCLIMVGIGILPLAAWLLRNLVVADSAANRSIGFHLMGFSDIHTLIGSLLVFSAPFVGNFYLKIILFFLFLGLVFSGIALALKDNVRRKEGTNISAATQMFAGVFVTTYLLFLFAYNSLTNPVVDLGSRVLAPAFVFGIILVISVIYRLSRFRHRTSLWRVFLVLTFALISVNGHYAVSFAVQRHRNGSGFTSRMWADSESIEYAKTLSPARTIYSNGVDAIYSLTGREALRIPAKFDPTGGKNIAEFERDINAMRDQLMQNRAVVLYLDKITWRWYLPSKDELENVYKVPVLVRLEDGVVYGTR